MSDMEKLQTNEFVEIRHVRAGKHIKTHRFGPSLNGVESKLQQTINQYTIITHGFD